MPDRLHRGQPVWVIQYDGSQRPAEYVGEAEQAVWYGGPARAIVAYVGAQSAAAVDAARVIPRDGDE